MLTENPISGIHHITAVASSAAVNLAFYEGLLGLRLVKQTVNFDDPHTYHLYYGDAGGAPGTLVTFFPWEHLPPGTPGAGMLTAVAMTVARSTMDFWAARLTLAGVSIGEAVRFGDPVLAFGDPHGLPLELIGVADPPGAAPWTGSPVPPENAIRGLHSATASLNASDGIRKFLTDTMDLTFLRQEGNRRRFVTADRSAPGHFFDVVVDPQLPAGKPGGGTVHHIAFRTASDRTQGIWQTRLRQAGLSVTEVRDRNYFRSIYFHSPGGVLFEIATDPPGFGIDEAPDKLGTDLKLPGRYEPIRAAIEARLPKLRLL